MGIKRFLLFVTIFILGMITALSAHVVMLQGLHVPYPDQSPVPQWMRLLNGAVTFDALVLLCIFARSSTGQMKPAMQALVVFLVFAMTRETLRGTIMNGVVTTGWSYAFLAASPNVVYLAIQAFAAVLCARWLETYKALLAGLATFGILALAVQPAIGWLANPVIGRYAYLAHDEVYRMPYGMHVLVPAYLTYLEPGLGCVAAYALTSRSIGQNAVKRVAGFAMLYLTIRGVLLATLFWSFYLKTRLIVSFMSEGQFLLEFLILALFVAIGWELVVPSLSDRQARPRTAMLRT